MKRNKEIIAIKNSKGDICDCRIPYDVPIKEEVYNIQKLIDECRQQLIETTGIPKERLNKEHEND